MPVKSSENKIKLNHKHWLNIMIISVSAMLLLSVLVGRMLNNEAEYFIENESLSPLKVEITQIDFSDLQFNLNHGLWSSSNDVYQAQQIKAIVARWQVLMLQHGQPIKDKKVTGKTVLIYLSGLKQPVICKISLTENATIISFISAELEFIMAASQFSDYYPQIIP